MVDNQRNAEDSLLQLADEWADTFRRVSDPTRLRLLLMIHFKGPEALTTTELANAIGVKPVTASAALRQMTLAGEIEPTKQGREVRYRIIDPRIHDLLHYFGGIHENDSR